MLFFLTALILSQVEIICKKVGGFYTFLTKSEKSDTFDYRQKCQISLGLFFLCRNNLQCFIVMVQNFGSVIGHEHQILDPHTHITRKIDSRLD